MRIYRLYSGNDGQSHIEELPLSFAPGGAGDRTPMQNAKGVMFQRMAANSFMDWHNAPRRQYVITLTGSVEIGLGDGSKHVIKAGDGVLAEDLTGKGHTTRTIGNEPRVSVVIPLAD